MSILIKFEEEYDKNSSIVESHLTSLGVFFRKLPVEYQAIIVYQYYSKLNLNKIEKKFPYVRCEKIKNTYPLASHVLKKSSLKIICNNHNILNDELIIIAGPCSVESEENIHHNAKLISKCGVKFLRGGIFKPRTSPYSFQGFGKKAIQWLADAAKENNMYSITEVMDISQLSLLNEKIDILQVGSRNMQNFSLLKALGKINKPVLLKRGMCATYEEFLMAAEYMMSYGNSQILLCERGVRSFESYTRNMIDITAIPALKELSRLPVIIDPSHGTGRRSLVASISRAAVAAGCDGIMLEARCEPDKALTDAKQTISINQLQSLASDIKQIKKLISSF